MVRVTRRPARPPTSDPLDTRFMLEAACVGTDPESYFPVGQGMSVTPAVKKVCGGCPVAEECLAYAITTDVEGWWAATTHQQRRSLRKLLGMPLRKMNMDLITGRTGCGTEAGHQRHIRNGEKPCPRCAGASQLRSSIRWDKARRAS